MKNAPRLFLLCVLVFTGFFLALRHPVQAETPATITLTSHPVTPRLSQPVSSLPPTDKPTLTTAEIPSLLWQEKEPSPDSSTHPDPLAPTGLNGGTAPDPLLTFEGLGSTGFTPPDPVADVGPNHFVQMVNVSFQIWDKGDPDQGIPPTILQPATEFKQLFAGTGGACETFSIVPIVLYDDLANRWLMAQYAQGSPFFLCVAISTTPDPTG
ncbi:MAG TPA: hypothetical protein PK530_14120, partial [Anaerolineales bacterium]|nr:hypothetical protein [Anaerolineales bacterium]